MRNENSSEQKSMTFPIIFNTGLNGLNGDLPTTLTL